MTTPQALAQHPHQAFPRHDLVDKHFAGSLTEEFGISCDVVLATLEGEPQKQAMHTLSWAQRTADTTYALRCWARRHGKGSYHVPREGPPCRSVGRRDRHQGYRGRRPPGCSLRAVVVDTAVLDRITRQLGVA